VIEHGLHEARYQLRLRGRHIGVFKVIVRPAQRDVGVHLFHPRQFDCGRNVELFLDDAQRKSTAHLRLVDLDVGQGLRPRGSPDQRNRHLRRYIERIDEDPLPFLQMRRKGDKNVGEAVEAGIVHSLP
jgi:hypothetical protein